MRVTVRHIVALVVLGGILGGSLGLAGCGGSSAPPPGGPPPGGTAKPEPSWTSCEAAAAPVLSEPADAVIRLPRLGTDFVPTAVVVCHQRPERRADGGQDLMAVESRASESDDVAAVLAAVRLPDEPRTPDVPCTADLPGVAWFALVDGAGRWVRPGVPFDKCGKIRVEVRQAVKDLTLVQVAARPLSEIESSGAAASGCTQGWADMVWVTGQQQSNPPPATRDDPFAPAAQLRVCLYRVPPNQQGSGKPAGQFERGGILPAERRPVLAATLRAVTTAPACTAPASRFALVRPADNTAGALYVELDGCRRVLVEPVNGPGWLGKADESLIALVSQP